MLDAASNHAQFAVNQASDTPNLPLAVFALPRHVAAINISRLVAQLRRALGETPGKPRERQCPSADDQVARCQLTRHVDADASRNEDQSSG